MSAWGHALRRLTEKERNGISGHGISCSGSRCDTPSVFAFTYRYVTGRRGRVSWAQKYLCQAHAERTAKRHGLELPGEAAEGAQHASEVAVEQMLGGGSR